MASPISPNPISPPLLPGSDKLSPMGKLGERPVVIIFKKDSTNPPGSMQKTFEKLSVPKTI